MLDGSDRPGFMPIGARRGRGRNQQAVVTYDISAPQQQKRTAEPSESEVKIAEKKARLAKYGVKFQSAGHLATIKDEGETPGGLTSYQALVLNSTLPAPSKDKPQSSSSSSSSSSSHPYSRHFVAATHSDTDSPQHSTDMEEKKKELTEQLKVVGATKRKLERLEQVTAAKEEKEEEKEKEKEEARDSGGEEDFTTSTKTSECAPATAKRHAASSSGVSKKPAMMMGGKFTIKLTGERYESFYY